MASAGGTGTLAYQATGLPPGLSLDAATGLVSGTIEATAAREVPYTVQITASNGIQSAAASFQWLVQEVSVVERQTLQVFERETFLHAVRVRTGATGPLVYSASGLPEWMTLDPLVGTLSGAVPVGATRPTAYPVTVTVTAGTARAVGTVWVSVTRLQLKNPGRQNLGPAEPFLLRLEAESAGTAVTYSATGLPAGLAVDPATGAIAGRVTSTSGTGRATVSATARGVTTS